MYPLQNTTLSQINQRDLIRVVFFVGKEQNDISKTRPLHDITI